MVTIKDLIDAGISLDTPICTDTSEKTGFVKFFYATPEQNNGMKFVCLQSKDDVDIEEYIDARFQEATENDEDELDVFMELYQDGFRIADFKNTKHYEYARDFMMDHGLV